MPTPAHASAAAPAAVHNSRDQRRQDAQAYQQAAEKARPFKRELKQTDRRMAALGAEKSALEQKLTQPLSAAEIAECGNRLKCAAGELETLEQHWLELSQQIEEI